MARPISDGDQYLEAYRLHVKGWGPKAILTRLEFEFKDPASLRTVNNWVKKFKRLPEDDVMLDSPFEWHRLNDADIPWDASDYLLKMWRLHSMGAFQVSKIETKSPTTFREARWWWRVHLAVPSLGFYDVWAFAEHFTLRELAHLLQAEKLDFRDLEAYLSYRPWEGEKQHKTYRADIEKGSIPPLRDVKKTMAIKQKLKGTSKFDIEWAPLLFTNSQFPESLPSQWATEAEPKTEPPEEKRKGKQAKKQNKGGQK
jgi:hypothetical protein